MDDLPLSDLEPDGSAALAGGSRLGLRPSDDSPYFDSQLTIELPR
jgi:hypothetical protein